MWAAMQMDPPCATEILCAHLAKLGLKNPSEPTSSWIAAIIICVMYGPNADAVSQDDLQTTYESVKSQLKRYNKREPLIYCVELPVTAAGFLKDAPAMALQVSPKMVFELAWLPARG
jgi:hypothetical protein